MKHIYTFIIILFSLTLSANVDKELNEIIHSLQEECAAIEKIYDMKLDSLHIELNVTKRAKDKNDYVARIESLEKINEIKAEIERIEMLTDLEITKLRYIKGIELIKLLYEKILGLDHHFTSLQTFQNISDLTNPNSYPEFTKAKESILGKMDKKKTPAIPDILNANPFVSLTVSIVSTFVSDGNKVDKEKQLNDVACILDFSVKMHADLNLIYYETEFLRESNLKLKSDASTLFKDYTQIIDYHTPLHECRSNDDWDNLFEKLDEKINYLVKNLETDSDYERLKILKTISNLEFSVDRLLNFMDRYIDSIIEGEQYYSKFDIILNNYQNESLCVDYLPHQFDDLRDDINHSIEKFSEAYSISEIKGTKLRDLLYGIPQ